VGGHHPVRGSEREPRGQRDTQELGRSGDLDDGELGPVVARVHFGAVQDQAACTEETGIEVVDTARIQRPWSDVQHVTHEIVLQGGQQALER
jgi:hypothetical protein